MVLVDWEIKQYISQKRIEIEPYDEKSVNPASYDLHLSNEFVYYFNNGQLIDPFDRNSIIYGHEKIKCEIFTIQPGQFILAATKEHISLPKDVSATIEGKSSLARLGLSIHQTGGYIDNGFSGDITLEIKNENCRPIRLYSGMPICQIVFQSTNECECGYGERKTSKYQNQRGAVVSRYHLTNVLR